MTRCTSADSPFVWDEITLPVRYGSDYELGRRIVAEVAEELVGEYTDFARAHWDNMVRSYRIEPAQVDPLLTLEANDNWVEFNLRYVVDYRRRRSTRDALFTSLLTRLNEMGDEVQLASATYEIVSAPPLDVTMRGR